MIYMVLKDDNKAGCLVEADNSAAAYSKAQRIGLTCIGYAEPFNQKVLPGVELGRVYRR